MLQIRKSHNYKVLYTFLSYILKLSIKTQQSSLSKILNIYKYMATLKAGQSGYTLYAVSYLIGQTEIYIKAWSKTGFKYTREWNKSCQRKTFPQQVWSRKVENSIVKGLQIDFVYPQWVSKNTLYTIKEVSQHSSAHP